MTRLPTDPVAYLSSLMSLLMRLATRSSRQPGSKSSGCHGKLQNFHFQKIPNFAIIKTQSTLNTVKIFAPTSYL